MESAPLHYVAKIAKILPSGDKPACTGRKTMSIVTEGEYKGNPMIVIKNSEEDKFPFQFGLKKAKLIVENIEAIKEFVNKYDKPK
jgi:hypothetical protein